MARKNTSPAELLILAPWWVSATLSGLVFAAMRWVLPAFGSDSMGLNGDASAREYRTYTTPQGQGLKSTAAPITDTWTDANNPVVTRGGGQQIVVDKPTSAKFSRK